MIDVLYKQRGLFALIELGHGRSQKFLLKLQAKIIFGSFSLSLFVQNYFLYHLLFDILFYFLFIESYFFIEARFHLLKL